MKELIKKIEEKKVIVEYLRDEKTKVFNKFVKAEEGSVIERRLEAKYSQIKEMLWTNEEEIKELMDEMASLLDTKIKPLKVIGIKLDFLKGENK